MYSTNPQFEYMETILSKVVEVKQFGDSENVEWDLQTIRIKFDAFLHHLPILHKQRCKISTETIHTLS